MAKRRKSKKGRASFIGAFLIIIIIGAYFVYNGPSEIKKVIPKVEDKPKLKIVNEDSKTRPVAVMINNNHQAWPHAGLNDAYITYEIIVEGGISRIMAIFKDKDTSKIGSVRSARPYFLDYALENDAIFVHFGWSDKAKSDISLLDIDNINGLTDSSAFFRDTSLKKASEHTAFTTMDKIKDSIKEKGYRRDTNKDLLLNYSVKEIDLSSREDAMVANSVYMKYSYYTNSSYEYDSENKVYKRSMSGTAHIDAISGEQYTYKNVIITPIKNRSYDSYGRQELDNIGSGDGYYITNGYAIPITWEKASRSSQTVYKDKNGDEIKVNDGRTFIQITPLGEEVTIN